MSREYEKNDDCLKRILTLLQSEKNLGVLSMDLRTSPKYNNDIYKRIYKNTLKELVISGHSLNKTINTKKRDDLRDEFMDAIIRLVKNNCFVRILLLKVNQSDELKNKRRELDDFVREVYKKLGTVRKG